MLKAHALGNLGRDAEVRTLENGRQLIEFTMAHTEKWNNAQGQAQEKTTWVKVTKWIAQGGSTAVAQYLKQGTKVYVSGKVDAQAYQAKDLNPDGTPQLRATLTITAEEIELCGGNQQVAPQQQAAPQYQQQPAAPAPAPAPQPATQPPPPPQPVWDAAKNAWTYPTAPPPPPAAPQQPAYGTAPSNNLPF